MAIALVAAIGSLPGCAGSRQVAGSGGPKLSPAASAKAARHGARFGLASYYGRSFQGRVTASGEKYDAKKLTAAHRSLPFGTRVRVTNLANGRDVVVRVNDRGPNRMERIIDLSLHAAEKLKLGRPGITRVRIEIL